MKLRAFFSLLIILSLVAIKANASEWQTDYEQALATAKASGKYVLLDFTGSDWCVPCIQLNKAVFTKANFQKYAEQNLVLVEIDFPRRKALPDKVRQQNERLAQQYHVADSGFPTVVLLNPDGRILGQLEGYGDEKSADVIAWIEKLRGNKKS